MLLGGFYVIVLQVKSLFFVRKFFMFYFIFNFAFLVFNCTFYSGMVIPEAAEAANWIAMLIYGHHDESWC